MIDGDTNKKIQDSKTSNKAKAKKIRLQRSLQLTNECIEEFNNIQKSIKHELKEMDNTKHDLPQMVHSKGAEDRE